MLNDRFALAAGEIAREAGLFLKRFSDSHHLQVENKGSDFDFVTNADRESQAMIAARLRAAFPEHRFVGEEDGLPDAEVAARLSGNDYYWVCDPLDGTINYIHGLEMYAVSIGLVRGGSSVAGAIYLPATDELFCAARGQGAWMNGAPIRASACDSLRHAFVSIEMPVSDIRRRATFMGTITRVGMACSGMRMTGCACYSLAQVARGRMDAYMNLGLHAWDVAAAQVILEEAGAVMTDVRSDPFHYDMAFGALAAAPGLRDAFRGIDAMREVAP